MELPSNLPEPSLEVELRAPLAVKGGLISTLRLREPTAQEMWTAEGHLKVPGPEGETLCLRQLVASLVGCKAEDLEDVPISDLNRCSDYLMGFATAGLPNEGEGFKLPEEETWELELPAPIHFSGRDYASLSLCEPTTGAVRKAQGQFRVSTGAQAARGYQMHLVCNTAGVPFALVGKLPVSVLNAAASYVQGFIVAGRRTGSG